MNSKGFVMLLISLSALITVSDIVGASSAVEVLALVLLWLMGFVVGVYVGFGGGMNAIIRILRDRNSTGQR